MDTVLHRVRRAFANGRAACAYIVAGDVRGAGGETAAEFLRTVFCRAPGADGEPCGECDGCRMAAARTHPDLHLLAPEKKSRIISVDSVRANLIGPLSETPFCGGWKAGVIEYADCLNESSSNALLKTLEEPPSKTLFLLLTAKPENLLPTIISRCQLLDAGRSGVRLPEGALDALLGVLSAPGRDNAFTRSAAAAETEAVFKGMEETAAAEVDAELEKQEAGGGPETEKDAVKALVSARYRGYRRDAAAAMEAWFRDLAAVKCAGPGAPLVYPQFRDLYAKRAAALSAAQCFANVEAMEALALSLERNLPEAAALAAAFAGVSCGGGGDAR